MTQNEQGRVYVRRRGMTALPNGTVHDSRLSYAALGLLMVLLARPDGVPGGYRHMTGRGLGETATRRALRELSELGYRHQIRRRGTAGRWVTDTVVSEEPITAEEARSWLIPLEAPVDNPGDHAAETTARPQQRKRRKTAGGTVQRPTAARSTEARSGNASLRAKVSSLRSETGDTKSSESNTDTDRECGHGYPAELMPNGLPRCPLCRHAGRY